MLHKSLQISEYLSLAPNLVAVNQNIRFQLVLVYQLLDFKPSFCFTHTFQALTFLNDLHGFRDLFFASIVGYLTHFIFAPQKKRNYSSLSMACIMSFA